MNIITYFIYVNITKNINIYHQDHHKTTRDLKIVNDLCQLVFRSKKGCKDSARWRIGRGRRQTPSEGESGWLPATFTEKKIHLL